MTVEQRLAKLERQNRWMRRGSGLVLAAVACVVLVGQGKAKELPDLVAKSLTIVDSKGKTRAVLGLTKTGSRAVLRLYDAIGGDLKVHLGTTPTGPVLFFLDGAGNPKLRLSISNGNPALQMSDGKRDRLKLVLADGDPGLMTFDAKGNVTWHSSR